MNNSLFPVFSCSGNPYEVGVAYGAFLNDELEQAICDLLDDGLIAAGLLDKNKVEKGSMKWFYSLPARYQEEMMGVADGAGIPKEI